MRFTVARLCGGKALMMIPREPVPLDLHEAGRILSVEAEGFSVEGPMSVCRWRGMEMTLYDQGKVMFYPLEDRKRGIALASELHEMLAPARSRG